LHRDRARDDEREQRQQIVCGETAVHVGGSGTSERRRSVGSHCTTSWFQNSTPVRRANVTAALSSDTARLVYPEGIALQPSGPPFQVIALESA
jgi:hypothetical protein